ncbi:MAG: hypothetical protein U5K79_25130 [Cyclobacteriaceae bacterium]|nr:hypothetical protein [Cyclobacteriaceae bacterium]
MPDQVSVEKYTANLPIKPKGTYRFAIQLFDPNSGKPVEIGLSNDLKHDHYFVVQALRF